MIFVTVGMHYQGFKRLIKKIDEIAKKIDEEVVMQIGYTKYKPKNVKFFDFLSYDEIIKLMKKSRLVICHSGAGTLLDVFRFNKPTITTPRLKKFGEHIDDQQIELAEVLSEEGKVIAVYDSEELEDALKEVERLRFTDVGKDRKLVNFLKEYIGGLEK